MEDSVEVKAKYAEIAALKKAIEEQKKGTNSAQPYPTSIQHGRGGFRGRGRARGRGYRGGYRGYGSYGETYARPNRGNGFRNLSFSISNAPQGDETGSNDQKYVTRVSQSGVTLMNTETYEKDVERLEALRKEQALVNAKIAEQRRLKHFKAKLTKYRIETDSCDRVQIEGDKFAVTRQGNKLVCLTMPVGDKAKVVTWNNRTYIRKSNGHLKCTGGREKRVSVPPCRYFSRTGICQKGSQCSYLHDKARIQICRSYLLNKCYNKHCLLSHECNEHNTPICKYHLERQCSNPQCRFQHWKPKHYDEENYEIWLCRPFAIGGWCERGHKCPFMHLFQCPDFEEDGVCPREGTCTLTHQITKRTQDLMVTPSNKYIAPEKEEVVVESDEDKKPDRICINSYTVDPEILFVSSVNGHRYDIYIDEGKNETKHTNSYESTPTFKENSEFLIVQTSDESEDGLEENDDYIHF